MPLSGIPRKVADLFNSCHAYDITCAGGIVAVLKSVFTALHGIFAVKSRTRHSTEAFSVCSYALARSAIRSIFAELVSVLYNNFETKRFFLVQIL